MRLEIHPTAIVYPDVRIADGVSIGPFSVVGKPYRQVHGEAYESGRATRIGTNSQIGAHVIIGAASDLGDECIVEDACIIECNVVVGYRGHFLYRAYVCNEANIGANCIIGGFVCERAEVAEWVRIFGNLVHKQVDPTAGWDDLEEESPVVEDRAFVGFDAKVIGGVTIGRSAYVCSGAIVTRDVPALHVACGLNQIQSFSKWSGPLADSNLFKERAS